MWISEEERKYRWSQEKRWEQIKSLRKGKKKLKKGIRRKARSQVRNIREAQYRKAITKFWGTFDKLPNTSMRLDHLRETSKPSWARVKDEARNYLRRQFNKNWSKFLANIDAHCGVCGYKVWKEKHHIIPLSHGGMNEDINLIAICRDCHDQIHPWMVA